MLTLAITASDASAELPLARLTHVVPAGGQLGTSFELSVQGADLDDAVELRFSDSNIVARAKVNADSGLPEPGKFVVAISSNALPGRCDVRAIGRFGVSNPRAFEIGQWPETAENAGNHSLQGAMEVALNSTINAQADANAIDHYRFAARKGQRITIECCAGEIESRMEPSLILLDTAGRELDRSRRGGVLCLTARADGTNLLKVSDLLYRGGPEFQYRLTIHGGARVEFILPASAIPNTTNKHVVYGYNLPGGVPVKDIRVAGQPVEQLEVEVVSPAQSSLTLREPVSLAVDGFAYRLRTPAGTIDPVFIGFATAPVVVEQPGNDRADSAQKLSVPCEYSGQLFPAGDQDWVTFEANKGEVYWIEIFAHRMGVAIDPFFVVQRVNKNEKGEITVSDLHEGYDSEPNIGGHEFRTSHLDPAWRLEVKEDGAYRIQVRDLFSTTVSDPRRVYRLAIRKEFADFRLAAIPVMPLTRKERQITAGPISVRRGETVPMKVFALRRDNFGGEITLNVAGLPPYLTCSPGKIDAGKNSGTLLFTARDNATDWNGTIEIIGRAKHGEAELTRKAVAGFTVWPVADYNNEPVESRLASDIMLGIVPELTPVSIEVLSTNALEAAAGTKLKLPVTITRRGDFADKLKLKIAGAQPVDSVKEMEIEGKATNATFEINLSDAKISPGRYTLYFQTQAKGKYRKNPEGAAQAEAAAKEGEKLASDAAAEAKKTSEHAAALAKVAVQAEGAARAIAERLSTATTAAEANSADEKLLAAKRDAEKALAEASDKAKSATEAKAAAEKTAAEAGAKAKSADAHKAGLAARAKDLSEKAKPRDLTVSVYSRPFEIKVLPAPVAATTAKK